MIKIDALNFSYADGTKALVDICCEFTSGHISVILGDSGSGKTTLLNCIGRFLCAQSGVIAIDGVNSKEMTEAEFRQKVGVVFQKLDLFPHLNILQNLTLAPIVVQRRDSISIHREAEDILERLGIAALGKSYPAQVSGGQAQRAAIARALMLKPAYLLLDEPTSALDSRTTDEFALWLKELRVESSFVVVTHDLLFARAVAREGIYMEGGRITGQGKINDLVSSRATVGGTQ